MDPSICTCLHRYIPWRTDTLLPLALTISPLCFHLQTPVSEPTQVQKLTHPMHVPLSPAISYLHCFHHPSSLPSMPILLPMFSAPPTLCPCRYLLTYPLVQLGSPGTPNFSHTSGKRQGDPHPGEHGAGATSPPESGEETSDEPHQTGCLQSLNCIFLP